MDNTTLRGRTSGRRPAAPQDSPVRPGMGPREGYSPSQREIAEELGFAVSTVHYHLSVLQQDGSLRRGPGQPRTIVEHASPAARAVRGEVEVPLIGQIAAGVPLDAVELAEETFLLSRRLVGRGTLFMLRVKGTR